MAANDRIKTKELKKEFQEMKGKILEDLGESMKPPKQFWKIFDLIYFIQKKKKKKRAKLTVENLEKLNERTQSNVDEKINEPIKIEEEVSDSKKKDKKQKKKKEKEKPKWAYTEKV